jgi:hypothetical protein
MKAKNYLRLLTFVVMSATILFSCKSSFPVAGTVVDCNGKFLTPTSKPTKKAEFPGGRKAMFEFLNTNLNPPQDATNSKARGKIKVAFIVTTEGEICDVRITSKPKEYFDNEVIRVVKMMPKWIPGINKGNIVDSYCLLDIKLINRKLVKMADINYEKQNI